MPAPLSVSLPETGLPAPLSVSLPETGLPAPLAVSLPETAVEHAAGLFVGGGLVERGHHRCAQRQQGFFGGFGLARRAGQRAFQRQGDAFHHGVEQIGLVLEVPVDGAARGAGRDGDVVERGARNALRLKQHSAASSRLLRVAPAHRLWCVEPWMFVSMKAMPLGHESVTIHTFMNVCILRRFR